MSAYSFYVLAEQVMTESSTNIEDVRPWGSLNWPNRISLLRLALVAPFVVLLARHQQWPWRRYAALGVFIVMALSDLLDGLLAERLNAKTRLGALLDPLADKILMLCAVVMLSIPQWAVQGHRFPNWLVVAIIGKDLWVIFGFIVIYLVTDRIRISPTAAGKACTFTQLWLVGFTLLAPELDMLADSLGTRIATTLTWATAGLCVWAAVGYTRMGLKFIAEDQKPLDANDEAPREAYGDKNDPN